MNSPWTLLCFGALQARRENDVMEKFRTQKTAVLLVLLALRKRARREELCRFPWLDAPSAVARYSLFVALSALRREPLSSPSILLATLRERRSEYFTFLIESAFDIPLLMIKRAELEMESDNFRAALG